MKYDAKKSFKKAAITAMYVAGSMLATNPETVLTPFGGLTILGVFLARFAQDWVKNKDLVNNYKVYDFTNKPRK
ncbi:MAG: hypothetical protein ABIK73_06120 [candidate division WOR-3 bacterium]